MSNESYNKVIPAELEQALTSCTNLPSLPAVALNIIEASKDPDITLHQVSVIISSDPAIAAKLLKIANSPLYSQRRSLNNLREALSLLGFNASLTIALSFTLMETLGKNKNNHDNYWKRSILTASIARLLGSRLGVTNLEDLFLASLLQDIGILVIQCLEDSPYSASETNNLKHDYRIMLEKEKMGLDHASISAWLLNSWNLPEYLCKSAKFSHSLNTNEVNQSDEDRNFHYCVNLAGNIADVWLDEEPGKLLLATLDVAKNVLNVNNDTYNELILEVDEAIPEIAAMFDIALFNDKERQYIVNEAREILLERSITTIKQAEDDRRYINDITDRIEKIENSSRLDHLTTVYNRQYMDELLDNEFKASDSNQWPLSLAFIDIDDFKLINDTYGHLAGDELLKLISEFFKKNIRDTDVIARYGGDEFILMLPGSPSEVAASTLHRLVKLFKEKIIFKFKNKSITASISIGLATHHDNSKFNSLKDFIAAADEALYKAKSSGKNCMEVYK